MVAGRQNVVGEPTRGRRSPYVRKRKLAFCPPVRSRAKRVAHWEMARSFRRGGMGQNLSGLAVCPPVASPQPLILPGEIARRICLHLQIKSHEEKHGPPAQPSRPRWDAKPGSEETCVLSIGLHGKRGYPPGSTPFRPPA
ncbi:hypothetical protein MPNT_70005 [Candidatus Methylacidithermus pantelleriae]|uniref:Uncharacterized protein n=1 Tax=Candidatus Methylacidithermus pantelleriae TaxID=2744239 RepID=A0A8J2BSH5_9BACT|nr:hypothetical protein MPNT_70005 [Candidatus Methylacidithermus pantelleriae]